MAGVSGAMLNAVSPVDCSPFSRALDADVTIGYVPGAVLRVVARVDDHRLPTVVATLDPALAHPANLASDESIAAYPRPPGERTA